MAVEILYPDASGDYSDWAANTGNAWDCVNDTSGSPDDDTTYIYKVMDGAYTSSYNLTAPAVIVTGDTINSVTVYFRAKITGGTGNIRPGLVRASSLLTGTSTAISTSYTTYSEVIARPGGGSWVFSDLAALQVAIQSVAPKKAGVTDWRVTQLYISVDYTAAGSNEPPTTPLLVSPQDNSTILFNPPHLFVSSVTGTGTITYQLQLDTESGFNSPVTAEISGLAFSVPTSTGWNVPVTLTQATTYYWRARANNGLDSNWSTVSGFTVGQFPAPTGLQCEKQSTTPVSASGYPCFSSVFLSTSGTFIGDGNVAKQMQVAMVSSGNDFSNPIIISDWVTGLTILSGSRSPILVYSGFLSPYYDNAISGLYWAMRFKNNYGIESLWGSGGSFYMSDKKWINDGYNIREKIDFGTSHGLLSSGSTVSLQLDTGATKVVATNAAMNEGQPVPVYANGKTHVVYLSKYDPADNELGIHIVTKDHVTGTWGTPVKISNAGTTSDTHYAPYVCVDNQGYIHCFYGCHNSTLKYRRSVNVNDSSSWTAESGIATLVSYPIPVVANDGTIYCFYRQGADGGGDIRLAYTKSTNNGTSWSAHQYIAKNTGAAPYAVYCFGVKYDRSAGKCHLSYSFINGANRSMGVWYAWSNDFASWFNVTGTQVGITDTNPDYALLLNYTTDNLVVATDDKIDRFCRPLVIDSLGSPHLFYTSNRTADAKYWPDQGQQYGYNLGTINHAVHNGSSWQTVSIGENIENHTWNARTGVEPIINQDDSVILYMMEKPLRPYSIQPAYSGTYSDFTRSDGTGFAYDKVNSSIDSYLGTAYLYASGIAAKVSFSGATPSISGYVIDRVDLETIYDGEVGASFRNLIRVNGVDYNSPTVTVTATGIDSLITRWDKNPNGNSWTFPTITGIQFGIDKTTTSGQIKLYDLLLRVYCIDSTTNQHYSGEVVELSSNDMVNWIRKPVTKYSEIGAPFIGIKREFTNNQIELTWNAGTNIYYYSTDPLSKFKPDGSDFKIMWSGQQIDRVADVWNNDSSLIRFKLQSDVPSGVRYGGDFYYFFHGTTNNVIQYDNPQNVYNFFENFETYPGMDYFGYNVISGTSITDSGVQYSTTNSDTYSSLDGKDERSYTGTYKVIATIRARETAAISADSLTVVIRVANSATWTDSNVVATGTISSIDPADFGAGWNYYSTTLTGFTTTNGCSVKADWTTMINTSNSGNIAVEIDNIKYWNKQNWNNWVFASGGAWINESPPMHNNRVFAGGKSLAISGSAVEMNLERFIASGLTNKYVECAIRPISDTTYSRFELVNSGGVAFGFGIGSEVSGVSQYLTYSSGTTEYPTWHDAQTQNWYRFKALITPTGIDGWVDDVKLISGFNPISTFEKIRLIGIGGTIDNSCYFDFIKIYDYLPDLTLSVSDIDYKSISFTAVIQGKQKLLIGFNYAIDQKYIDYQSKIPFEWFSVTRVDKKIQVDNTSPVESNSKILEAYSGYVQSSFKYDIDVIKIIDGLCKLSIENTKSIDQYNKFGISYNSDISLDSKILCEYTESIGNTIKIELDYGAIVSFLCKFLSDNTSSIEASAKIFSEHSLFVVAMSKLINGYLASIAIDNKLNIDDLSILEENFKICSDYIKNIESDSKYSADFLQMQHIYSKIISGYLNLLSADSSIIPDWLASIASDFKVSLDNLGYIVSIDNKYNIEPGLSSIRLIKLPEDYLAQLSILHKIPFEWLGEVVVTSDIKIPVSYLGTIEQSSKFPIENTFSTNANRKAVFEYNGTLSVDSNIVVDNISEIVSDTKVAIDQIQSITNDLKVLAEFGASAIKDNNIPISNLSFLEKDTKIGLDNLGAVVITIDNKIPLDFTASIDSNLNISIDRLLDGISSFKIATDNSRNLDIFTKMPIDVISNIYTDKKINIDTISNIEHGVKIPDETLRSLESDYIVPLEYTADGLFIIGGTKIPTSWLSSLNCDNKLNIDHTRELSSVMGSSKVLIDYGRDVNYCTQIMPEFQLSVKAMAKVIDAWCSKVDAMAKISISRTGNIERFIKLDIDFGKNVGSASSKIPIDYLAKVVKDTNLPLDIVFVGILLPMFFRNITFSLPQILNLNIDIPSVRNVLLESIKPIVEALAINMDNVSIVSPEAREILLSGQSI